MADMIFCGDVGLVTGMTAGTCCHMLLLAAVAICTTDWKNEAYKAKQRVIADQNNSERQRRQRQRREQTDKEKKKGKEGGQTYTRHAIMAKPKGEGKGGHRWCSISIITQLWSSLLVDYDILYDV